MLKTIIKIVMIFGMVSCAPARWEANIVKDIDLVWPPPPNQEKVSYLGELNAFTQVGTSLKTIIFGKGKYGGIAKPVAIAVGSDGRIAIADTQRLGVHLYVPSEQRYQFISSFGEDRMLSPVSVAFDSNLRLVVSDSGLARVMFFDPAGKFLMEISTAGKDALKRPTGVVYHELLDSFYLVDTGAHKVHIYDNAGTYKQSFGERGMGDGEFNIPTHIAVDFAGDIYVNDAMNFRLQVFSPPDKFKGKFGHHGDGTGDFAMPKGVAVDKQNVVYVAETLFDVVQVFNLEGEYLMKIGEKGSGPGKFWMPSGLFIDRKNILYVCDTYNKKIQLFQLEGSTLGGFR